MDYIRFLQLHRQYSLDNYAMSMTRIHDPSYVEMRVAGEVIVPWLLQRLQDTVGHDEGDDFDASNDPWLSISLLSELTSALKDSPYENAGRLDKIRAHILRWGSKLPKTVAEGEVIKGDPIIILNEGS